MYRDDAAQAFEDIALGAAVEQLLELARGQHVGGALAGIAGVASGFEGEVAGCGKGPVSGHGVVGRVHSRQRTEGAGGGRAAGNAPVSMKLEMRDSDSMAVGYAAAGKGTDCGEI
jgi:hypothetical protein